MVEMKQKIKEKVLKRMNETGISITDELGVDYSETIIGLTIKETSKQYENKIKDRIEELKEMSIGERMKISATDKEEELQALLQAKVQ